MAYAKDHPDFKVDLVGHSAGSIVICHLLEAAVARYPDFRFGRIALLAPAARMDLFTQAIVNRPERFEQLRMYTMKDELEQRDAIAGPAYPLSLVFFVSGTMEDPAATPICGLARCLAGSGPYAKGDSFQAHQYMHAPDEKRLVLAVTDESAAPGLRCNARHHGDFDNLNIRDEETGEEEKVPGETIPSLQVFFNRAP
jgi:pimeloyl-ACP methyl ester carboxylesterase